MTFWAAGALVVGGLAGAAMSSNAAENAADTQAGATDRASAANERIADKQIAFQRDAMDRQIALQQPFRSLGLGAQNRLAYLMGLSNLGADTTDPEIQRLRSELQPQFTKPRDPSSLGGFGLGFFGDTTVDENGLQAAIQARLRNNGQFGSLMHDFSEAPPSPANFSMKDYQEDPGYQFNLSEGEKERNRFLASRGLYNSGRAGKELARFSQGLASQEYGNAFNRFQTNRANQIGDWQNRLNLFNVNRNNTLAPLQSLGGVAQSATNQMGAAVGGFAQGASGALGAFGQNQNNNIIGAGNARAAGQVGSANAINGGISQGISMYQNNQLMNRLFPQNSSVNYSIPQGSGPSASGFGGGGMMDELQGYGVF